MKFGTLFLFATLLAVPTAEAAKRLRDFEKPPHNYWQRAPQDRFTKIKTALETGKLPGGGIRLPIPALEKLRKKNRGAARILDKILPGLSGGQAPAPAAPPRTSAPAPQPAPTPEPRREKPKVEDLLKGILRGLTR